MIGALFAILGVITIVLVLLFLFITVEFLSSSSFKEMLKNNGYMTFMAVTLICVFITIFSYIQYSNPPLLTTYTLPISTIKETNDISHQISFVTDGTVINVTNIFGRTFPENSKLNINVYGGWKGGIYINETIKYTVTTPEKAEK